MWWPFKKKEDDAHIQRNNDRQRDYVGRRTDYSAAGHFDSLQGWPSYENGTINALMRETVGRIRARARFASRNNELVRRYLQLALRNIIGYEMRYKCTADWRKNKRLENGVRAHAALLAEQSKAENFTVAGRMTRGETENVIMEQVIRDGEAILQRVHGANNSCGYALRLLDPARIATQITSGRSEAVDGMETNERIINGIGVDPNYNVIAYYMNGDGRADMASQDLTVAGRLYRIPARNVLHIFKSHYANQVRGMSWLAPVLKRAETLQRYEETAMQAARSGAAKHMTIKTTQGASYRGDKRQGDENVVSMDGESVSVMSGGEELQVHNPAYPAQMYADFVKSMQNAIAGGLDSTPPGMTGEWDGINFSAGQLLSLDDRDKWETHQQWFSEKFCCWWHDDWIRYQMLMGRLRSPETGAALAPTVIMQLLNCKWEGKQFAPIDPAKAATAASIRVQNNLSSLAQEIRKMGGDPDEVFREIQDEKKYGITA